MDKYDLMEQEKGEREEFQAIIKGMSGAEIKSPIFRSHREAVAFISKWLGEGEDRGLMEERHRYAAIITRHYEGELIQSENKYYFYEW